MVTYKDAGVDVERGYEAVRRMKQHVATTFDENVLGGQVVRAYEHRIINIHPALIPAFCGFGMYGHHVHEAVLAYGAKISGATTHFVDEQVDHGGIIMQRSVPVLEGDTPDTLAERVLTVEHQILPESVKLFCAGKLGVDGRHVHVL